MTKNLSEVQQIVVTKVEEPVDEPRGEVFKLLIFNNQEVVHMEHFADANDLLGEIKSYLEDLKSI